MASIALSLGAVFEIESILTPCRVIAYDDCEVMYDTWWPHLDAWSMTSLRGDRAYYRLPRQYVEANATQVGTAPLTAEELQAHRPELPFAVARRTDLSWYDESWEGKALGTSSVLPVAAIYLAPFSPRDRSKPSLLLTADDGNAFTERELLSKARALQAQFLGNVQLTDGVGIYRTGIKKRIPSYYIWGALSRAEAPPEVLAHAARYI